MLGRLHFELPLLCSLGLLVYQMRQLLVKRLILLFQAVQLSAHSLHVSFSLSFRSEQFHVTIALHDFHLLTYLINACFLILRDCEQFRVLLFKLF